LAANTGGNVVVKKPIGDIGWLAITYDIASTGSLNDFTAGVTAIQCVDKAKFYRALSVFVNIKIHNSLL
jgi:hypothetical protein